MTSTSNILHIILKTCTLVTAFIKHWLIFKKYYSYIYILFSSHVFSPPLWATILLQSAWCWNEDILSSTSNAHLSKQAAVGSVFHLALWEPIMPPPARAVGRRRKKKEVRKKEHERGYPSLFFFLTSPQRNTRNLTVLKKPAGKL